MNSHRSRRAGRALGAAVKAALLASAFAACSESTGPVQTAWQGQLVPVAGQSVNGSAAAVSGNGRTRLSIGVAHGTPGATYLWRVDQGACTGGGAVLGGTAAYAPMEAGAQGNATSETTVPGELDGSGSYSAHVLLQADSAQAAAPTEVACADLHLLN